MAISTLTTARPPFDLVSCSSWRTSTHYDRWAQTTISNVPPSKFLQRTTSWFAKEALGQRIVVCLYVLMNLCQNSRNKTMVTRPTSSYTPGMCVSVSSNLISHSSPFRRVTPFSSVKVRVARMCSAFCEHTETEQKKKKKTRQKYWKNDHYLCFFASGEILLGDEKWSF